MEVRLLVLIRYTAERLLFFIVFWGKVTCKWRWFLEMYTAVWILHYIKRNENTTQTLSLIRLSNYSTELMKIDFHTSRASAETLKHRAEQVFYLEIQPCWTDPRQVCWLLLEGWQSPGNQQINERTDTRTSITTWAWGQSSRHILQLENKVNETLQRTFWWDLTFGQRDNMWFLEF